MSEIDKTTRQKLELVKLKKQLKKQLSLCFSADDVASRASEKQEEIFKDEAHNIFYILGSNRCLAQGTMLATPKGPKAIEDIVVGDWVYSETGKPIQVLKTHDQGMQDVYDLTQYGQVWATCTDNHKWQAVTNKGRVDVVTTEEITKPRKRAYWNILRTEVEAPLGDKEVKDAYILGAMLGDGCSTEARRNLIISSADNVIPGRMAEIANTDYKKLHKDNYHYQVNVDRADVSFYEDWCHGRCAHEKIVDLEEVKTWNRQSVLSLLAGVLDSDGSVYVQPDGIIISIGMQASSVIDFVEWAFLALWQYRIPRHIDARDKYKNGNVHYVSLKNRYVCMRALKELTPYVALKRKQWNSEWEGLVARGKFNPGKIGVQKTNKRSVHCYDITVGSMTNLFLLANGLVSKNSGKTQLGSREIAWWFQESHPFKKRRKEWGTGPLQILVMAQTDKNAENEIWNNKLKKFLIPGEYKEVRAGNSLQRVENLKNGNVIIFFSHHNAAQARKAVQGFTAHIVWVDEMPESSMLISELVMRTVTCNGYFYATFTPLVENEDIRKMVDTKSPKSIKYKLTLFDNPGISERLEEIVEQIKATVSTKAELNARLYGDWYYSKLKVFSFDKSRDVTTLPDSYSRVWRHVVAVDPAASGDAGLTVWAEDPSTLVWYCVMSELVAGDASFEQVEIIEDKIAGLNVVRRVCDCNPAGFYKEANSKRRRLKYMPVKEKKDNKDLWIDDFNTALVQGRIKLTSGAALLQDELLACKRSEETGKIVGESKYHTADSARYFWQLVPKAETPPEIVNVPVTGEEIRKAWCEKKEQQRKAKEQEKQKIEARQRRAMRIVQRKKGRGWNKRLY